ncbi:MAG: ABC transporter ATP-binding protein [Wenzhouxiangella sp.]
MIKKISEPLRTVRRVLPILWASARTLAIVTSALLLLEIFFGLATLFLIKRLVDALTANLAAEGLVGGLEPVMMAVALTAGSTLALLITRAISGLAREAQGMRVADYVDRLIHNRAIAADLSFYESPLYFDTLQRARQSGNQRPAQVISNLLMMGKNLIMLLGVVVLMVSISWTLLPVLLIAIVPALLVRLHFTRILYEWRKRRTQLERRAGYFDWLLTSDYHAKELRLNQLGAVFRDLYSDIRQTIRGEQFGINRRRALIEAIVGSIATAVFFGALAYLAYQTAAGRNTVGDLVLFLLILQRAQSMGQELVGQVSRLFEDHLYINQLFDFLEVQPLISSPDKPQPLPNQKDLEVSMEGVSFIYPGCQEPVLRDINLRIKPGQVVALVGSNGSGKTSLIKLLCRLYDPSSGTIRVDGRDARDFDLDEYRSLFSVVFQDFARYATTVRDNIRYGDLDCHPESPAIAAAARLSGAEEFIEALPKKYDTFLNRAFDDGVELSVGQWQKIALARALLRPSRLAILDEPTSAIDPNAEFELFENFRERLKGRSALIISHRLSTIRLADYIYVLEGGRIAEAGRHEALMYQKGLYHQAFNRQGKYYREAEVSREAC